MSSKIKRGRTCTLAQELFLILQLSTLLDALDLAILSLLLDAAVALGDLEAHARIIAIALDGLEVLEEA
jgi:hypothetical protein